MSYKNQEKGKFIGSVHEIHSFQKGQTTVTREATEALASFPSFLRVKCSTRSRGIMPFKNVEHGDGWVDTMPGHVASKSGHLKLGTWLHLNVTRIING